MLTKNWAIQNQIYQYFSVSMAQTKVWKPFRKVKIAATVYNDKEGQAKAMAELVIAAVTGKEMEDIQFENNRCIYLPYKKVTKENVETMIK